MKVIIIKNKDKKDSIELTDMEINVNNKNDNLKY